MNHDYYRIRQQTIILDGQSLRVAAKPGLPHWETAMPAEELLVTAIDPRPEGRLILLGCGAGAVAAALARKIPYGWLEYTDTSHLALQLTALTLQWNDLAVAPSQKELFSAASHILTLALFHPHHSPREACDTAAILLPKGRSLARRWLLAALHALRPGGACFLAGANAEGVQSVLRDGAELFGNAAVLAYKKGSRVARLLRAPSLPPMPAWAQEPGIAPGTWRQFNAQIAGDTLSLFTLPGVFSADTLDEGTALLLQHLEIPAGGRVLDFGCGCGVIGLWAAQRGAAQVDLVDVNLLAVAAAQENIARLKIPNARAFPSDVFEAIGNARYDLIATNPPFHTGKEVDYAVTEAFLSGARAALNPGGRLVLVANRFIRYEHALQPFFNIIVTLAETGKYRVLEARVS